MRQKQRQLFILVRKKYLLSLKPYFVSHWPTLLLLLGIEDTNDAKQQRTNGQKNEENNDNTRFVGRYSFVKCTVSSTPWRSRFFQLAMHGFCKSNTSLSSAAKTESCSLDKNLFYLCFSLWLVKNCSLEARSSELASLKAFDVYSW